MIMIIAMCKKEGHLQLRLLSLHKIPAAWWTSTLKSL